MPYLFFISDTDGGDSGIVKVSQEFLEQSLPQIIEEAKKFGFTVDVELGVVQGTPIDGNPASMPEVRDYLSTLDPDD